MTKCRITLAVRLLKLSHAVVVFTAFSHQYLVLTHLSQDWTIIYS